jgi:hypothetical protein
MVSVRRTPGTSGWPGKVALEDGAFHGHNRARLDPLRVGVEADTRSIISKYSSRMRAPCRAARLF